MNARIISWTLSLTLAFISMHAAAQVSASSENTIVDNGKSTYRHRTSNGFSDFDIEMRGKIEITDDDKDIKSMSDDGYLEITKTVFGSRRSIIIESMGGGKLKKEYYEGRTKMDWNSNGKAWLSEVLPDVVRSTTIGAESRVQRFFKKGGTSAVLAEIKEIEGDHTISYYANLLMKQPVPVSEYANVINTIKNELESDHYLSEFLKNNVDKFLQNKQAEASFFAATERLESDHYKTVVIKEALRKQATSAENVKVILQSASKMESDHYLTEVLTTLLAQEDLAEPIIAEMISTTKSIESDHYKTLVLTKALDKKGLTATSHRRVVESIKTIDSDHYLTQVIQHLADDKLSDDVLALVLELTASVESDHYRTQILNALINRQDIKEAQFNTLVEACGRMDSDHYKMTVLKEALKSTQLTDNKLLAIINGTKAIVSDHYITEVLVSAAPKVKAGSQSLKDAYRQAAKSIDSETYYGKALRAID